MRIEASRDIVGEDVIVILKKGQACGIGFELVLALPPLMWLYRRRRQARL